jgi:hypothetical protein
VEQVRLLFPACLADLFLQFVCLHVLLRKRVDRPLARRFANFANNCAVFAILKNRYLLAGARLPADGEDSSGHIHDILPSIAQRRTELTPYASFVFYSAIVVHSGRG